MEKEGAMKIGRVVTALVALGALAAVASVPMVASAEQTLKFRIAFRVSEFHELDQNGDGDTDDAGDSEVGNFVLKRGGERRGHLNFHCLQTQDHPPRDLCWATIQVTGKGAVTVGGSQASNANTFIGSITGGTGAYRGASGVFKIKFGRTSIVTLEID